MSIHQDLRAFAEKIEKRDPATAKLCRNMANLPKIPYAMMESVRKEVDERHGLSVDGSLLVAKMRATRCE